MVRVFGQANRFAIDELDDQTRQMKIVYRQLVLIASHPGSVWSH